MDKDGHETKKKPAAVEGDVNRHGSHGNRGQIDPKTGEYSLESEHIDAFAAQRENMRNPSTGKSPIPEGRGGTLDNSQTTPIVPKTVAKAKTALDTPIIARAQAQSKKGPISPATAAELGPDAAMVRLETAFASQGKSVPNAAYVAQAGQINSLFVDPEIQKFTRLPENNVLLQATNSEIDAAVNIPISEAHAGNAVFDMPPNPNPRVTTPISGNFGSSRPSAPSKLKIHALTAAEYAPKVAATFGQTVALTLSVFGAHKAAHEFEDRQPPATSFLGQVAIDVSTLGFFLTETAVGLVDDAAAGAKAFSIGDWGYGEYMMESYMQSGMSPAQRQLLNYLAPPR